MANERKTSPVRIGENAMRLAKIASGYLDLSAAEYITRIVEERAAADVERLHAEMVRDRDGGPPGL